MADEPTDLVLEHLKRIQADIGDVKRVVLEIRESVMSLRDDVHGIRGDLLRHERALAALETDVSRIKTRLDMVDEAE